MKVNMKNNKQLPKTPSLARCVLEEVGRGNSFSHVRDGNISVYLFDKPFHRIELNSLILESQGEIETWCITDALLDREIDRILKNNLTFPELSGYWREDISQFHLELRTLNLRGQSRVESLWSPVPELYATPEGLATILPVAVGNALKALVDAGNEIQIVDDESPNFVKVVFRYKFEFSLISPLLEPMNVSTFFINDPHYQLLTGLSVKPIGEQYLTSMTGAPIAKQVIVGYLNW
jgi:hypothetical protein